MQRKIDVKDVGSLSRKSPAEIFCKEETKRSGVQIPPGSSCWKPLIMGVQKDLTKLVQALRGGKRELVKYIIEDDQFAEDLMKRLSERKIEKQIREAIEKTTGY